MNHRIRQRDLSNLTKSLERQVGQDKELNFYTLELKKIVDELETKLGQTSDSSPQLNDKVLKELKLLNKRFASIGHPDGQVILSTDSYKLNILLAGLTLLSLTVLYDLFANKIA